MPSITHHTIESIIADSNFPRKAVLFKLLPALLNLTREQVLTNTAIPIPDTDYQKLSDRYREITEQGKPFEYVIGYGMFDGRAFDLNEHTLIPRPETEYMIEAIKENITTQNSLLIDVGTGSGVLGISALANHPQHFRSAYLCDLSAGALDMAQKNAKKLLPTATYDTITRIQGSLLARATPDTINPATPITLVSNLPYIPDATFEQDAEQQVKDREPHLALLGGDDWLDLYRIMIDQVLNQNRTSRTGLREMMTRQTDILRQEYPQLTFQEIKTFHANIRIISVTQA